MIQGVIFDLDGVICSTDEYHYQAWNALAEKLNIPFSREINNRQRGVSRMESLEVLLEQDPREYTLEEKQALAEEKNQLYVSSLMQMTEADLDPQVRETLDWVRSKGIRMAIGSSSKNAPLILRRIGLEGYFDAVAHGGMIQHSKPDPEVFLLAANLLDLSPEQCLVVEDAETGIQAAKAAGMRAAAIGSATSCGLAEYNLTNFGNLKKVVCDENCIAE